MRFGFHPLHKIFKQTSRSAWYLINNSFFAFVKLEGVPACSRLFFTVFINTRMLIKVCLEILRGERKFFFWVGKPAVGGGYVDRLQISVFDLVNALFFSDRY